MRALLALLALGACAPAEAPPPATITVRGVYVQPLYGGQAALVDHEAIPDRMPAMRMAFRLDAPALLDGVAEGAPVRLTLDSLSLEVLGVDALPPGTDLDLEEADRSGGPDAPPEAD